MTEAPLLHPDRRGQALPARRRIFARPARLGEGRLRRVVHVHRGESFGLVGESGCGKTTIGRLILRLIEPTSRAHRLRRPGHAALSRQGHVGLRRRIQIIFQDPYASLDPRMTVEKIVTEPLRGRATRRPAANGGNGRRAPGQGRAAGRRPGQISRMSSPAASASASGSPVPCASGPS